MFKISVAVAMVLMLVGSAVAADGPIEKGSMFIDGAFYFQSQSGDLWENGDGDAFTTIGLGTGSLQLSQELQVTPAFGYFVAPGLMIGGQLAWTRYAQGDNDLTLLAIGPGVGYYFKTNSTRTEIKGSVYPYIRGFVNYGKLSEDDWDVTVWQFGARGGMLWMVSSAVGVDLSVMYKNESWEEDDDPTSDSESGTVISAGAGISAFIF
jgi:hypothetical protein